MISKTSYSELFSHLVKLKELSSLPKYTLLSNFEEIASVFVSSKSLLKPLIEAITAEVITDTFYSYYLGDVADNTLARPDEYSYSRNFVQAPFWISILYSKLAVCPPQIVYYINLGRRYSSKEYCTNDAF